MMAGGTSPVLSPTNGLKKPKMNLRVQIPMEGKDNATLTDTMVKTEESSELPPVSFFAKLNIKTLSVLVNFVLTMFVNLVFE